MTNYYISTTGNDANDGLSPSTPFATAQHAYDVASGVGDPQTALNFAAGTYGGIVIYGDFNYFIKGDNNSNTFLGGIINGTFTQNNPSIPNFNITIFSDGSISLGTINATPYGEGNTPTGNIYIYNGNFNTNSIVSNGTNANSDNVSGANAGNIYLYNCTGGSVSIQAIGGNASVSDTSVASGGAGGNIYISSGSSLTYTYSNVGGRGSQAPNGADGILFTNNSIPLYYNNAQSDGDWGNINNWWQDLTYYWQAVSLPTNSNSINLYNQVTQNTQGADQCFCSSANFWSANFGAGLTLQSTGVVNMQGSSVIAGSTTDSVSMHDSSQLTSTSVVAGNVTMRDSSRAFGSILGNATIYYDGGNGQYPIGGTVVGTVTYLNWPAVTPQYFNDQVEGSGVYGNWQDQANWWTDESFSTRPINTQGYQQLPDAGTTIYVYGSGFSTSNDNNTIAVNEAIFHNYAYLNTPVILNVSIDAKFYEESGVQGYVYGSCYFYNNSYFYSNYGAAYATGNIYLYDNSGIYLNANADHPIANGGLYFNSLLSLENTAGYHFGGLSDGCAFNISTGGEGGGGGFISRLLHLPWFINI